MRLFAAMPALRGTITWGNPFGVRAGARAIPEEPLVVPAQEPVEFDEDGRRYAFRFRRRPLTSVTIDRDRLFDYARRRRKTVDRGRAVPLLPDMRVRRFVRDLKNSADFFTGVRELQTHADVSEVRAS